MLAAASPIRADLPDPASVLQQIRSATLDLSRPIDTSGLRLNTGFATLDLNRGALFPVRTSEGRILELVFIGRGEARLQPPNEIEASQLELFTGHRNLIEPFTEAVFVIARDPAAEALVSRPLVENPDPLILQRARDRYAEWKDSPERRSLGVETGILLDALGDPLHEDYFAGWFLSEALGPFLLQFDPAAEEQINLGQFVRFEVEPEERHSLAKYLHRQQRRGRMVGLDVDKIGRFDSWLLAAVREDDSPARAVGFEPLHYAIDATVDPRSGRLVSRSSIVLRAASNDRRTVRLELHGDLKVTGLLDADGEPLFFLREGNAIQVVLAKTPRVGTEVVVEVACEGQFFDRGLGLDWALRDGRGWYPRVGPDERATYDVTIGWPRDLELLASGSVIEEGESEGLRWQRRRLDHPALGFSFEVGDFTVKSIKSGHVKLTVGFDPETLGRAPKDSLEELAGTASEVLKYYERTFGKYPLSELTLVTVPRQYSQAMLGFITLSGRVMADSGVFGPLLRIQDHRSVIAHELAHQWWGHLIGWQSYRDQWISEAMANYSALLWTQRRGFRPAMGPISGWQQELTATIADGRSIESLGPMVLGERLFSSRSKEAYHSIVYRKGTLVLQMLARKLGEEQFLKALGMLARQDSGQVISTADFLSRLQQITSTEIDRFARQFIFGTGLPEVYYDYEFEPAAEGRWKVRIEARQQIPSRYRYEVVTTADGRLDVGRKRIEQPFDIASSELVVPFRIRLARDPQTAARRARNRSTVENGSGHQAFLKGQLVLVGRLTELEFEIDHMPARLQLDHNREVFSRFFDRRQHPKRVLLQQAVRQMTTSDHKSAEATLHRALATRSPLTSTDDLLDVHLHLLLASVHLTLDRDADAESRLDLAREALAGHEQALPHSETRRFETAFQILEGRIEIRRGFYEAAFQRLHRGVLDRNDSASTEGYLLLAIAAEATNRQHDLAGALEVARTRGADTSRLRSLLTQTQLSAVR